MRTIYSKDNKLYKLCRELHERRGRKKHGLFLIEGEKLTAEALLEGVSLYALIVREGCEEIAAGEDKTPLYACFSEQLFAEAAQTESPQALMAVCEIPERLSREEFEGKLKGRSAVVLDRLQDPGNVGTIIRTAEAAGMGGVVLVKGTSDVWALKTVRAAAGSLLRMPLYFAEDAEDAALIAKDLGLPLAVSELSGDSLSYEELAGPALIVIGNEGGGISEDFIRLSDIRIHIPMRGKVESLNAAIAAALIMYGINKK